MAGAGGTPALRPRVRAKSGSSIQRPRHGIVTTSSRPSVAFETLGCRLNQADSEELARRFLQEGYNVVGDQTVADVIVVNSCTVTHLADRQSRQAVRHAARQRPDAIVVLTGCYPSVSPEEARQVGGVTLVVGNRDKDTLVQRVTQALAGRGVSLPDPEPAPTPLPGWFGRTRVQLKVEEGCNNRCSFCIVPVARGVQRSRTIDECVAAVGGFEASGYREVVLTGTHLGGYGRDLTEPAVNGRRRATTLSDLVAALLERTGIERIRLSSVEPQDFHHVRLDLWQDRRLCRHFHLPVQSGSNAVLRRMRRGYTRERYLSLVGTVQERVSNAAVTTDVIAGFPGEDEADFQETCSLVEAVGFAKVHAFPYSPRDGTDAAVMDGQLDPRIKRQRIVQLTNLSDDLARRFRERHVGTTVQVLWEEESAPGMWQGLTGDYLRVQASSDRPLHNRITSVRVTRTTAWGCAGEPLPPPLP